VGNVLLFGTRLGESKRRPGESSCADRSLATAG